MATKFNLELYLLLNVNVGEMIYTQRGLDEYEYEYWPEFLFGQTK